MKLKACWLPQKVPAGFFYDRILKEWENIFTVLQEEAGFFWMERE
ncbi:hypothetical protein [Selenomonas ruminantium]|nr:hypothetical protein [Selenomonas ruminantium]